MSLFSSSYPSYLPISGTASSAEPVGSTAGTGAFTMDMKSVIQADGVVTNLEFHEQGQYLAMTTNASAIQLIDCFTGQEKKKVFAKSLGISKLQYTHHEQSILLGTDKRGGFGIRYLSLYDNRYLRLFQGHSGEISALSMSPISDTFLSAAEDSSICLWDMKNHSNSPAAKLTLPASCKRPLTNFDTAGVVFGALCYDTKTRHSVLKLYDAREFQSGPFENIFPSKETIDAALSNCSPYMDHTQRMNIMSSVWTDFEFSADGGRSVLVNTNRDVLFLLDGYSAATAPKLLLGRKNENNVNLGASFSADAKYVITGNDENDLLVYDKETTELVQTIQGHVAPVKAVRCNRVYNVVATGCVNTALWTRNITK